MQLEQLTPRVEHRAKPVVVHSKNKMKKIVTFGRKKFICELKKVRVKGKKEKHVERVFCRELKAKKKGLNMSSVLIVQ